MLAPARLRPLVGVVAVLATTAGCGDDATVECVSNDVGEVCADAGGGAINFRGTGLSPGSEVVVGETAVGPMSYTVDDDGSFDPGNSSGVMSVFSGTEFVFDVTATDADGNVLSGQIAIATD
jgi:hypothetical protein